MAVFDEAAKAYDSWYESAKGSFADKVETDLAFNLFHPEKETRVLDAGCGTGNFSIKLAHMGCRVTGVDISEKMLDTARKKAQHESLDICFKNMNLYDLRFKDESFDGIFSMAALEFLRNPGKALEEMYRVTVRGGKVLVGTINRESSWGRLYTSPEYSSSIFRHARFMTMAELENLLPQKPAASGECLFIPPQADTTSFTMENEKKLSKTQTGGFFCVLWNNLRC